MNGDKLNNEGGIWTVLDWLLDLEVDCIVTLMEHGWITFRGLIPLAE